jgi:Arc/MetJ-type ribon-helix-helix transcriptional regulator
MERTPKTRGRPPKGEEALMQPITIRLPPEMVARIDEMRAGRLDAPDKSTIIRELLAKALK